MMPTMFSLMAASLREHTDLLAFIGALAILCIALKALRSFWWGLREFVLAPALGLGVDIKSFGAWAVVTGSTDGIGKAYAEALARAGLNIILVSRSLDKLNNVAKEIEAVYKVETKVIAVDFTAGSEIYTRLARELQGIDIGILVNNVGTAYEFPMFFLEATDQEVLNIINVNCNAVTMLTKMVLPGMVERKKGVIINISSLSGVREVPLLSVYSSTKAFVQYFSRCIDEEYRSKGIIVQDVAPGFVATKLARLRIETLFVPSPTTFVRSAIATVGVTRMTSGCAIHAFQCFLWRRLPESLYMHWVRSIMLGARSRGMKKREKKE